VSVLLSASRMRPASGGKPRLAANAAAA